MGKSSGRNKSFDSYHCTVKRNNCNIHRDESLLLDLDLVYLLESFCLILQLTIIFLNSFHSSDIFF